MDKDIITSKILLPVLSAASILLLAMSFLFYQGNRLASKHAPLVNAVMELKLEATTGHLWFEEIMSGDRYELIETVWGHLQRADWYANAMLEGGENEEAKFYPLEDSDLRSEIISVRKSLEQFRQVAIQRYESRNISVPGSEIDQKFDQLFNGFINQADLVETKIQHMIKRELRQFYYTGAFILIASIILIIFLINYINRNERQRHQLLETISDSMGVIESKNKELSYRAHFDSLTKLPNRVLFLDRLEQLVIEASRDNSSFVLLFMDLDHFKMVNDRYGHQAGDFVLCETADRIKKNIRETDSVSRLSGDEFVIILKSFKDQDEAVQIAKRVADNLLIIIQESISFEGIELYVSASIGVAVFPEDSEEVENLLKYSDTAMYHAKAIGKNNVQFHTPRLAEKAQQQSDVLIEIREAIKDDNFEVHYQPQWYMGTDDMYGIEALVRLKRNEGELVYPDIFIPVGEKFGLIHLIDFHVFKQAIQDMKAWQEHGLEFNRLSLNVSPLTFNRADFLSTLLSLISNEEFDASVLELEIVESVLVNDNQKTKSKLSTLRNLGIRIAIDDFGTGYSSMSYLKDLAIDTIKVDQSFLTGYRTDQNTATVLKHIVNLGTDLKLNVIAEGVEKKEDEEYLMSIGCEIGQGYLCSKPITAEKLQALFIKRVADNVYPLNSICDREE